MVAKQVWAVSVSVAGGSLDKYLRAGPQSTGRTGPIMLAAAEMRAVVVADCSLSVADVCASIGIKQAHPEVFYHSLIKRGLRGGLVLIAQPLENCWSAPMQLRYEGSSFLSW